MVLSRTLVMAVCLGVPDDTFVLTLIMEYQAVKIRLQRLQSLPRVVGYLCGVSCALGTLPKALMSAARWKTSSTSRAIFMIHFGKNPPLCQSYGSLFQSLLF